MSSKQAHKLSGAEALDEYFTALLDEEWDFVDDPVATTTPLAVVDNTAEQFNQEEPAVVAQPKAEYSASYAQVKYNEYEVPDLDDVQKLLDKMSTTDLAAEPEIDSLIEQNTAIINQLSAATTEPEIEEVQEWVIDTVDTPVVEVAADDIAVDEPELYVEQDVYHETEAETELQTEFSMSAFDDWESTERNVDFQVLYFDVNGITFAVPLDELGGIHRTGEMSHLIGRPGWYLGLQTNKDNQYDVVDTAKWVMADRLIDDSHKDAYEYIVMLGNSSWGLAATELKGTESLNVDHVRWRAQAGKRPWLAGMVKEKMCALIHVEAMITMITAGMDVKSLDS